MPIFSLTLQFLQQQLNNTSFGYTITSNGIPITYPSVGTDFINKTFNTSTSATIGHIIALDENSKYYNVESFKTGFNGAVIDISRQTSGKYIVSGNFTEYNGQSAKGICRLNTDFSLDTSFTPPDLQAFSSNTYNVSHRLLSNDRIIVFGGLMQCGTSYYIGKLNVNGTIDIGFRANTGFYDGVTTTPYVNDIAIDDDDNIICVGSFQNYSYFVGVTPTTVAVNKIIRLTSNGSYDSSFAIGSGITGTPREVEWSPTFAGGDGYVIGGGTSYKGVSYGGLIKIDLNGDKITLYDSLTQTTGSIVTGMFMDALGYLTVSGNFNAYDGTSCSNIIRIKDDGTRDTAFVTTGGLSVPADVIKSDGYYTYVGGNFTTYRGSSSNRFAKINYSNGDLFVTNNYSFNDRVWALYITSLVTYPIIVGGAFTTYYDSAATNNNSQVPIAINSLTTQYLTWQNLDYYNSHPLITYTQVANNILVEYDYEIGDVIDVIGITDIPGYLEIQINGTDIPPTLSLISYPQQFTPVYNPITFNFTSPFNVKYGFRYIFNLYQGATGASSESPIATYKLSPTVDGSGYIDISKVLSNLVSVDFHPAALVTANASNSYVEYHVGIGIEYGEKWNFNTIASNTVVDGLYNGYIVLHNSVASQHTYTVGDQITITSSIDSSPLNGLHQVLEIIDEFNITIDQKFVPADMPTSTYGSTVYADNRKQKSGELITVTDLLAFNGARPWKDFRNWLATDYTITPTTPSFPSFLTNLPETGFHITPDQDIFLNMRYTPPGEGHTYIVVAETNNGLSSFIAEIINEDIVNPIQQIAVGFNQISEIFPDCYPNPSVECIDYYDVYVLLDGDPDQPVSDKYRFTLDKRCKIEDYEILFMDRMGSLASYAFQLRSSEKGNIVRNMFKQQIDYTLANDTYINSYDISERGSSITNVNVTKTLELNTNWMTDSMSVYFEELLTSPYTWLKKDGLYYACTIDDSSFEVTRQKNKNLIRKTVTVTWANNDTINI